MLRINFQESAEKNVINVLECSLLKRVQTAQKALQVFFFLFGTWNLFCVTAWLTVPVCVLNKVSTHNSGWFFGYSHEI